MAWNVNEDVPEVALPEVAPESSPEVAPDGSRGATQEATSPLEGLSPEEQRQVVLLQQIRGRMHDVSDDRFEAILQALRDRQSVKSVMRGLVEDGLCPHLRPKTIERYVAMIRDAMGLPGFAEQQSVLDELDKEGQPDVPVEGGPAADKLRWALRVQQGRLRRALKMEGMLGGMVLPQASTEMKLFIDLIDREMELAAKTGEIQKGPEKFKLEGLPITEPVEAHRVVLAWMDLQRQMREHLDQQEKEAQAAEEAQALPAPTEGEQKGGDEVHWQSAGDGGGG